jgi:O-antigen ligase
LRAFTAERISERGQFFGTAAFFALALLAGGLGPHAAFVEGLIEAAAFVLLVALALSRRTWSAPPTKGVVGAATIILLMLAVGIVQLIPLPASTWQALPGREPIFDILSTVGADAAARPLSVAPDDTRLVIQSWLPAVAMFFATVLRPRGERTLLAMLAIAIAGVSALLGLVQLSLGDGSLLPYAETQQDRFPGIFANVNHQALFLACAVAMGPALVSFASKRQQGWLLGAGGVLLLGALITSSRAGLALFAVATTVALIRLAKPTGGGAARSRLPLVALALAGAVAVLLLAGLSYRGEVMSGRFSDSAEDARFTFWITTWRAIIATWPFGTGFGTFEPVYQIFERLEDVGGFVVNHAHDDYLEFVLESGLAGVALIVAFGAWLVARGFELRRFDAAERRMAASGFTVVALVLLHSAVDYPLRTQAIGCLFAFACGVLVRPPTTDRPRSPYRPVP